MNGYCPFSGDFCMNNILSRPSHSSTRPNVYGVLRATLAGGVFLLIAGASCAQGRPGVPATPGIDHSGNTRHEIMSCNEGRTPQDRATCLKEARNAAADRRHDDLMEAGHEDYRANRMKRCDVFNAADDKAACLARVKGMGEMEGNVSQGGVIREVETIKVPRGARNITIDPKTDNPVLLVPKRRY
jgi:hypothetical protein